MSRTYTSQARHSQVFRLSQRRTFRRIVETLRRGALGRFGIMGSK